MSLYHNNTYKSPWLMFIKNVLDEVGLSNVWLNHEFPNVTWLCQTVRQRLKDQFLQTWTAEINNSAKCVNYKIYKKKSHKLEDYLVELPRHLSRALCKLRTLNIRLPIELGRYVNIPRIERTCQLCNSGSVGDEFHFLLQCQGLSHLRSLYLPRYCQSSPNILKLESLLCTNNTLKQVATFVYEGMKRL